MSATLQMSSISGTAVLLYPVPTPWPKPADCTQYIYRQQNNGLLLAHDPMYPSIIEQRAQSCFQPEVSSWWLQPTTANPSSALGPTFVCPESYTTVHTTTLPNSNSAAAQTQYIYCCPPDFTLGAIFPPNIRSVAQCTSTLAPGASLSFQSLTPISGASTPVPSSTIVTSSAATVFAPPVNGYNIVQRQSATTSTATATRTGTLDGPGGGTGTSTSTSQSTGTSPGTITGAVVGSLLGLALLVLIAFFLFRRRRKARNAADAAELAGANSAGVDASGTKGFYSGSSPASAVSEMPVKHLPPAHELPNDRGDRYELGGQEHQRFELPVAAQEGMGGGRQG
ncbi:hypothetical protein QBC34DRAFT_462464 [Podospora aff. communis PSN243]|uniref:Uncharacterized protein n=1 Tax=Podospora aff. communis PSN243 TaxID=3040156 RepID=A0AAV9GPA0_9PEZI|nr:hypothetical protein QBC34DRAFT_462464 [Podospora aff. communis PSN243]